jgi:hypothetical protein
VRISDCWLDLGEIQAGLYSPYCRRGDALFAYLCGARFNDRQQIGQADPVTAAVTETPNLASANQSVDRFGVHLYDARGEPDGLQIERQAGRLHVEALEPP